MAKEVRDLELHASFEVHRIRMKGAHCVTQDLALQDDVPKTNQGKHMVFLLEDVPVPIGRLHKAILWIKNHASTGGTGSFNYSVGICTDTSWTEASSFATMDALSFTTLTDSARTITSEDIFVADEWMGFDITGDLAAGAMERLAAGVTSFTVRITKDDTGAATVVNTTAMALGVLQPLTKDRTNGTNAPFVAMYGEGA